MLLQQGICKYGNQCTKVHTGLGQQLSKSVDNTSPGISSYYTKEPRFATRDLEFYSKTLPYMDTRSLEFIAVNKDGERIDTYVPMPSQDSRDTYGRLAKACRPCNYYHLAGGCETENCEYGHTPLDSNSLSVMKYILRQNACPRGARCRSLKCYLGHICQKDGCRGTKPCKFKPHAHTLDVMVARWDDPIERLIEDSPASEASAITHSMDDSGSVDGVEIEKAC